MDTRASLYLFLVSLFLFSSCGIFDDDDGCGDENDIAPIRIDDLIVIDPLQDVYNVGDAITLTVELESKIEISNPTRLIDLFEETGRTRSALGRFDHRTITEDNQFEVALGELTSDGVSSVIYNSETDTYELSFSTILNRPGMYRIQVVDFLGFPTDEACDYVVDTNVMGFNPDLDSIYEFTVIP